MDRSVSISNGVWGGGAARSGHRVCPQDVDRVGRQEVAGRARVRARKCKHTHAHTPARTHTHTLTHTHSHTHAHTRTHTPRKCNRVARCTRKERLTVDRDISAVLQPSCCPSALWFDMQEHLPGSPAPSSSDSREEPNASRPLEAAGVLVQIVISLRYATRQ